MELFWILGAAATLVGIYWLVEHRNSVIAAKNKVEKEAKQIDADVKKVL